MRQRRTNLLEDNDVRVALQPFLFAERDRLWLKLMRRNRDIENEVMKDVPGWKTGTWYGEPVYFTLPKDKWWDPEIPEPYVHLRWRDIQKHLNFREHDEYAGPHWWDKYMPDIVNDWIR
ncbi:unnamed protein product [Soboliphyme baturini]|uniref:NADH dehydrogenase [ubiquinone] 1 alpha subcomplex subunit 13 n=1 Tax=Soboliphyme baturini TaxID=241478 RepID=A0A183IA05_9BILA|nr:unnamed protein product [Soboliphyme baturini]